MDTILKWINVSEYIYPNGGGEIGIYTRLTGKVVINHETYECTDTNVLHNCLIDQANNHYYIEPDIWIGQADLFDKGISERSYLKGIQKDDEILVYRKPGMTISHCIDSGDFKCISYNEAKAIVQEYKYKGACIGTSKILNKEACDEIASLFETEIIPTIKMV